MNQRTAKKPKQNKKPKLFQHFLFFTFALYSEYLLFGFAPLPFLSIADQSSSVILVVVISHRPGQGQVPGDPGETQVSVGSDKESLLSPFWISDVKGMGLRLILAPYGECRPANSQER